MNRRQLKIRNRKIVLHRVLVPMGGRTYRYVYLTPRQHEKLNALPVGKEVWLSDFYCYIGGDMRVIRTIDGLQFMPSPLHTREWIYYEEEINGL
jgi:hypothetical protein